MPISAASSSKKDCSAPAIKLEPASEWIQRHTKERIIFLLQNKNLNISEIADEMGFSSRSFFTRYVKKLLGVTPKEYRERI
ncbi:helix-turn-helix domain-containing protein [Algoriphagus sp. NG3]|uniref:helix-turn-helix domain-containing protein n=1 Tax=Algoriphagus sp. NG3 TaxID=3097546 RepID=UPI0039C64301